MESLASIYQQKGLYSLGEFLLLEARKLRSDYLGLNNYLLTKNKFKLSDLYLKKGDKSHISLRREALRELINNTQAELYSLPSSDRRNLLERHNFYKEMNKSYSFTWSPEVIDIALFARFNSQGFLEYLQKLPRE